MDLEEKILRKGIKYFLIWFMCMSLFVWETPKPVAWKETEYYYVPDEYDEEDTHIEETSENHYIIDGMTLLKDLEEKFGIDFREEEFETILSMIRRGVLKEMEGSENA